MKQKSSTLTRLLKLFILLIHVEQSTQIKKYNIFEVLSDGDVSEEDKAIHLAAGFINHLRSELKRGQMYRHDKSQMPVPAYMTAVLADVSLKQASRKKLEETYLIKDSKNNWMCSGRHQTTLVKPYHPDFEDYHVKNFTKDLTTFAGSELNQFKTELYSDFIENARNLIVPLKADFQESLDATEKTDLLKRYDLHEGSDLDKIHEILGTDITQHKLGFDGRSGHAEKLKQAIVDKDAEIEQLNTALKEMAEAQAARRQKAKQPFPDFKRRPFKRIKPLTFEEFEAKQNSYREALVKRYNKADVSLAHQTRPPVSPKANPYGYSTVFPPEPNPKPTSVLSFEEWKKQSGKMHTYPEMTFDEFVRQKAGGGGLNNRKRNFGSEANSWEDIGVGQHYVVTERKKRDLDRDLEHMIYRSEVSLKFEDDFQQMWLLSPKTTRMWCSYHVCRAQCAVSGQTQCDDIDEQVRQVHIACAVNAEITEKEKTDPLYHIKENEQDTCEDECSGEFECDTTTRLCEESAIPLSLVEKVKNFFGV